MEQREWQHFTCTSCGHDEVRYDGYPQMCVVCLKTHRFEHVGPVNVTPIDTGPLATLFARTTHTPRDPLTGGPDEG